MKPVPDIAHLTHNRCQYGPHHLQRLGVWTWPSAEEQAGEVPGRGHQPPQASCWIIFIHGGSWRDPRNTYEDFAPSIKAVLDSSNIPQSTIRGFASLDYRLSAHPSFPQDLEDTPATDLRNAQHPDHILDIRAAIAYLDTEHGMGQDYILMGHSAGATLTYQLLMGDAALAGQASQPVPLPRVAIGISGIYDLQGLVTRFEGVHGGIYRTFVTGAFGSDEELWKKASPAHYHDKYAWPGGTIAMLAWSPEDTLIDEPEIDSMVRKMEGDGTPMAVVKDLTGDHEVVWEQGHQVARLVAEALKHMAGNT